MQLTPDQILAKARNCFQIEMDALKETADALNTHFVETIHLLEQTITSGGKLIFTGVGKNIPICEKLVGTFNSTGVPTAFLDPNQALHGDLGLCRKEDLAILISNSGETEDLLRIIPFLKRLGLKTIALTSKAESSLAKYCDHTLPYNYSKEACPLNLAPTASTTAALAIGDAIAMVYIEVRGFTKEDFAQYHPAGSLGQSLLLKVSEIMRAGSRFAIAEDSISIQEALLEITRSRCGSIALIDPSSQKLTGVFSDGDFRRVALKEKEVLTLPVKKFMTRNPKTIQVNALAVEALKFFEKHSIDDLIVVDENDKPLGLVDGQDMPKLRVL